MTHEPAPTNDLPRRSLSRIIDKHGRGICDSPKRVEALLRDLCGGHRREINIIMGAHEERVPADLIAAGNSVPRDVLLARLAARLRDNLAYTADAARWGVETWAVALGVVSEAELKERAREGAGQTGRGTATASPVREPGPHASAQASAPRAPKPQRGTGQAPAQQRQPQRNSQPPPPASPPAPTARRLPSTPPQVAAPAPHRQNFPTAQPTRPAPRRGLKLRSCLLVVVLIFALVVGAVFAIPAVIGLLREEQSRPSVNDPRIR